MPLASQRSNGACDDPAPILAAISKAENAVAELKKAYKDEVDGMTIKWPSETGHRRSGAQT